MYTVIYHFEDHEEQTEVYDFFQEMMDAIDFNSTYGYDLGYENRIPVKSLEIIF